jgi:hypothetical protein
MVDCSHRGIRCRLRARSYYDGNFLEEPGLCFLFLGEIGIENLVHDDRIIFRR